MKRRHRQGRGAASQTMPDAVMPQQFENPANPEIHRKHHGRGNLERHRRRGRHPRLRRRHRRHHHRRRPGAEAAQARRPDRRGRAGDIAGPLRRPARPAQDPGHRRRLRARDPRHARSTTRWSRSPTRRRSTYARARRRGSKASRSASRPARRIAGGARRSARGPKWTGKKIVVIIPSFAERYLSTALFEGLDT